MSSPCPQATADDVATDVVDSYSEHEEDHNMVLASHNKPNMLQGDSLLTSAFASLGSDSMTWKEFGGSMRSGSGLLGQGTGSLDQPSSISPSNR